MSLPVTGSVATSVLDSTHSTTTTGSNTALAPQINGHVHDGTSNGTNSEYSIDSNGPITARDSSPSRNPKRIKLDDQVSIHAQPGAPVERRASPIASTSQVRIEDLPEPSAPDQDVLPLVNGRFSTPNTVISNGQARARKSASATPSRRRSLPSSPMDISDDDQQLVGAVPMSRDDTTARSTERLTTPSGDTTSTAVEQVPPPTSPRKSPKRVRARKSLAGPPHRFKMPSETSQNHHFFETPLATKSDLTCPDVSGEPSKSTYHTRRQRMPVNYRFDPLAGVNLDDDSDNEREVAKRAPRLSRAERLERLAKARKTAPPEPPPLSFETIPFYLGYVQRIEGTKTGPDEGGSDVMASPEANETVSSSSSSDTDSDDDLLLGSQSQLSASNALRSAPDIDDRPDAKDKEPPPLENSEPVPGRRRKARKRKTVLSYLNREDQRTMSSKLFWRDFALVPGAHNDPDDVHENGAKFSARGHARNFACAPIEPPNQDATESPVFRIKAMAVDTKSAADEDESGKNETAVETTEAAATKEAPASSDVDRLTRILEHPPEVLDWTWTCMSNEGGDVSLPVAFAIPGTFAMSGQYRPVQPDDGAEGDVVPMQVDHNDGAVASTSRDDEVERMARVRAETEDGDLGYSLEDENLVGTFAGLIMSYGVPKDRAKEIAASTMLPTPIVVDSVSTSIVQAAVEPKVIRGRKSAK